MTDIRENLNRIVERVELAKSSGEPFYRTPGISKAETEYVKEKIRELGYKVEIDRFRTLRISW